LREFYFERPQRALVGAAALLAFVGVAALTIPPGPLRIDAAWSEWMTDIRSPGLDSLALVFNSLGRGVLRALSLVAVGGVLAWGRRWRALVAFAVVEAIAPALSTILKVAVDRPRPPEARLHSAGASFTSGHAVYAAATSAALVVLFLELGPRRRIGWILAALCTATMAWSRTYLQVHWLSDVVVGAALGAGVAFGVFACVSSARHEPARGDVAAPVDRQPHVLAVPGQHR
jgi:undecaprenyl-diphosphatase